MTKSAENKHKTRIDEGGYYAIKGFLYQFDKTLIEVITNPQTSVAFENRQDIDYEDYVLQFKHKETQDYTPRKFVNQSRSYWTRSHETPRKNFVYTVTSETGSPRTGI